MQLIPAQNINNNLKNYLNSKVSNYSIYEYNYNQLNTFLLSENQAIRFNLISPFANDQIILQRQDIRNSNYFETETNQEKQSITNFIRTDSTDTSFVCRTLKGFANNDKTKICRFVIEQNNFNGYIYNTISNKLLYYTSVQDFIKCNNNDFITTENYLLEFDITNLISTSNNICGNIEDALNINNGGNSNSTAKGYFDKCTPRFLEIAAEGDYEWCKIWGNQASSKIINNLFLVEGIYTTNFNLSFIINNINLITNNPNLYTTNIASDLLYEFQTNWNTNHTSIDRDVSMLFTGRPLNNNVLGIAFTGAICSNYAYLVSSSSNQAILTLTHELGHTFSSLHDNGSGGYGTSACSGIDIPIMCASVPANSVPGNSFFFYSIY